MAEHKTEPLKLWNKAKELRLKFYENYAKAHEKGGLRWAGGAWTLDAIPRGLGDDVWSITSEPYAASTAFSKEFSLRCLEAAERAGYARDLCSYMRNYWGSIILNEYAFPQFSKTWPKPDFIFQDHICCSHAKWYQVVCDLEPGVPMFSIDVGCSPAMKAVGEKFEYIPMPKHAVDYVVGQCLDAIEWLQKVTGRPFHDELLRKAIYNHMRSTSTWAKVCELQKNIPAPLDPQRARAADKRYSTALGVPQGISLSRAVRLCLYRFALHLRPDRPVGTQGGRDLGCKDHP
jgi:benzoyl-CoA reductase subunit B